MICSREVDEQTITGAFMGWLYDRVLGRCLGISGFLVSGFLVSGFVDFSVCDNKFSVSEFFISDSDNFFISGPVDFSISGCVLISGSRFSVSGITVSMG